MQMKLSAPWTKSTAKHKCVSNITCVGAQQSPWERPIPIGVAGCRCYRASSASRSTRRRER
eukprot:14196819-Alexandrium_andersonii.AAC.1